ncbi:hypothetical protein [Micromonospora sp. ATA51]|nr:hypothetical protein [Micromonospora sp. ATA51]MBM0224536.1 hypothetical protein [Micromonospora sp. ATA51]
MSIVVTRPAQAGSSGRPAANTARRSRSPQKEIARLATSALPVAASR